VADLSHLVKNDLRRQNAFFSFVQEAKPFRSKLLNNTIKYAFFDQANVSVKDHVEIRTRADGLYGINDRLSRHAFAQRFIRDGKTIVEIPPVLFNRCNSSTKDVTFKGSWILTAGLDDVQIPGQFPIPGFSLGSVPVEQRLRVKKNGTVQTYGVDFDIVGSNTDRLEIAVSTGDQIQLEVLFCSPADRRLFNIPYNSGLFVRHQCEKKVEGTDYVFVTGTQIRLNFDVEMDDDFDIVINRVDKLYIAMNDIWVEYRIIPRLEADGMPIEDIHATRNWPDVYEKDGEIQTSGAGCDQFGSTICNDYRDAKPGFDTYGFDGYGYDLNIGDTYYVIPDYRSPLSGYDMYRFDDFQFDLTLSDDYYKNPERRKIPEGMDEYYGFGDYRFDMDHGDGLFEDPDRVVDDARKQVIAGRIFIESDEDGHPHWYFEVFKIPRSKFVYQNDAGEWITQYKENDLYNGEQVLDLKFALLREDGMAQTIAAEIEDSGDAACTDGTFTFIGWDGETYPVGTIGFDVHPFDYDFSFFPPFNTTVLPLDQSVINLPTGWR
jgi:hypothetical protein